jgi:adenylate cyclase
MSVGVEYRASALVDALCLAFMLAYTTPLCALGYEETMRMYRMRERLRTFSGDLARQRDRLSRYVAEPIAARSESDTRVAPARRWLTVAFVDIGDFTALTERLEPEDLGVLLDDFFAALADLARQHGGNLHKFLGDGALITFGDARTEGRRADARACIAMLRGLCGRVARLNDIARAHAIPASLSVRAGVASGHCSVGDFGADDRIEYTVIGAPVNLASRIEGLAAAGETWVSASTCDLLDAAAVDPLGAFSIKGIAAQVPLFRVRPSPA